MISDTDRVGYIGASDTHYVLMNWNTQTFRSWWEIKVGERENELDTVYTRAGRIYEPKILDYLEIEERDRQIIVGRLRVNLDGETRTHVIEIKTAKYGSLKIPKNIKKWAYWQQVQVEMYATNKQHAFIYVYELLPSDYEEVNEIDGNRLELFDFDYDEEWIEEEYLPRFHKLGERFESIAKED